MNQLRGKNALLTGGSRGIGPVIARALASEGVNLVLAARTADELRAVADEMAGFGVRAVAVPSDVSDAAARSRLVERATEALGPIDILLNNAGIEYWGRFERQDPENIAALTEVNVVAPLHLTRLLLPGMIERGCGHIVTISSLSGKKGIPYAAAYAGSKAAVIEWTNGLLLELEGTGVGASVICPIYVKGTGLFARYGHTAPALAGSVSATAVARATVRALRQDLHEVLVRPGPTRPLLALNALSPALGNWIIKRMGIVDLHRRMAENAPLDDLEKPRVPGK